jgi:hypothetical protein
MSNFTVNSDMNNQVCRPGPGKKRERSLDEASEEQGVRSISPPIESSFPRRPMNRSRSQQFMGMTEGILPNSTSRTNNHNGNVDSYGWFLALDKN